MVLSCGRIDPVNGTQELLIDGSRWRRRHARIRSIGTTARSLSEATPDEVPALRFHGEVAQVGFADEILSDAEIATLYAGGTGIDWSSFPPVHRHWHLRHPVSPTPSTCCRPQAQHRTAPGPTQARFIRRATWLCRWLTGQMFLVDAFGCRAHDHYRAGPSRDV